MHEDRERQLQSVKNAIEQLKIELSGSPFNFADKRICRKMKASLTIKKAQEYLEELDAIKWLTLEEKPDEEGGWIIT